MFGTFPYFYIRFEKKNLFNSNIIQASHLFFRYDHRRKEKHDECGYNQNEGYVVFSAMGSFFIPMAVMVYVYVRISCVVAARHDHMTEIEVHKVIYSIIHETRIPNFCPHVQKSQLF